MKKVSIPTLIVAGLVVLILLAFACTFQVSFSEVAVKVRLGKADQRSIIDKPDIYFRWPLLESVEQYDVRLQTMDTPETEIKTVDGKNVIIASYAVWQIKDPLQFYKSVRKMGRAEEQMRTRLAQVQAAVVGRRSLSNFVNLDQQLVDRNYEELFKEMHDAVAPGLAADFGIDVKEIGIRRISLPKEVASEVAKSMIQDRKTLAAAYLQEGKARADAIKARAESDANQIMAFANRKAQEISSAGIQASERILSQIRAEDREFFEWLRWLEALKVSLANRTTIFIDQSSPFFAPFVKPPVPAEQRPQP